MFKTDVFSRIEANDSKLFITTLFCDSMTKENILNSCKKNKLYVTPKLNDVLYLHYQGKIIHPKFEFRRKITVSSHLLSALVFQAIKK